MTYINKFISARTISAFVMAFAMLVSGLSASHAASVATKFTKDLSVGMVNSADVEALQTFLTGQGYFTNPIDGNFDYATEVGVVRFQRAHVIPGTGYFGPLTRATANTIATASLNSASLAIANPITGTIDVGQTQSINWTSDNYDSSNVRINLIRKVGENPNRYELVRTIALSTKNDGLAVWVPAPTDTGNDLSIEVGCVSTAETCQAGDFTASSMAVVNTGRFANTANAYKAIEQLYNK